MERIFTPVNIKVWWIESADIESSYLVPFFLFLQESCIFVKIFLKNFARANFRLQICLEFKIPYFFPLFREKYYFSTNFSFGSKKQLDHNFSRKNKQLKSLPIKIKFFIGTVYIPINNISILVFWDQVFLVFTRRGKMDIRSMIILSHFKA